MAKSKNIKIGEVQSKDFNQQQPPMENGLFVDVTSIEEQQSDNGNNEPLIPSLIREVQIDRIYGERGEGNAHEYLIKWKPLKQSWVNAADIAKFPELVQAYEVLS